MLVNSLGKCYAINHQIPWQWLDGASRLETGQRLCAQRGQHVTLPTDFASGPRCYAQDSSWWPDRLPGLMLPSGSGTAAA